MEVNKNTFPESFGFMEKTSLSSLFLIVIIHVLGFLSIHKWMTFSGIGEEAARLELNYGLYMVYLLNLMAAIAFLIILVFYWYSFNNQRVVGIGKLLAMIFVLRGIGGYVVTLLGNTGTSSFFWALIFSTWALLTGIMIVFSYRRIAG